MLIRDECPPPNSRQRWPFLSAGRCEMLWTIFVILLVLWLLGIVTANTLNGYIHILLVIAIAVVLIRVISGRRPL